MVGKFPCLTTREGTLAVRGLKPEAVLLYEQSWDKFCLQHVLHVPLQRSGCGLVSLSLMVSKVLGSTCYRSL